MGMTKSVFGKTSNGEVVHLVTVSNQKGMSIEVLDYGATLVSVNVPDKDGHTEDVALGYDDVLETRISELPSEDAETVWIMQNFPSMEKNTSWKKMKARTSATAVPDATAAGCGIWSFWRRRTACVSIS